MKPSIFACCLFALSTLTANQDYTSDQLGIGSDHIYTISSFDTVDYFCTYDHNGNLVWEIPFYSKILSWKKNEDALIIFSKHRNGQICFLTCAAGDTGEVKWEKRISAPLPINQTIEEVAE